MLSDVVYSESVKCVKTYFYSLLNILIFRLDLDYFDM